MGEAVRGHVLGQLVENPAPGRLVERRAQRAAVERRGPGQHPQLEPWARHGGELEEGHCLRRKPRQALAHDVGDALRPAELAERPAQLHRVRDLHCAALEQVAPHLAQQQRRSVGQLADRRGELGGRVGAGRAEDELAHLLGAEIAEHDSRDRVEAREVGERVAELCCERLVAIPIGGEDDEVGLRRDPGQPAEQVERLTVGPVDVVGDEQQRLHAAQPREQLRRAALDLDAFRGAFGGSPRAH